MNTEMRTLHLMELASNLQTAKFQKVLGEENLWDQLWLATGSSVNLTSDPLLTDIARQYPLKVVTILHQ